MEIYVAGRRNGKTTRMLEWMREEDTGQDRVMVVPNEREAEFMVRSNPDLAGRIISVASLGRGVLHGRVSRGVHLGIDDADRIFHDYLRRDNGAIRIDLVTWNQD